MQIREWFSASDQNAPAGSSKKRKRVDPDVDTAPAKVAKEDDSLENVDTPLNTQRGTSANVTVKDVPLSVSELSDNDAEADVSKDSALSDVSKNLKETPLPVSADSADASNGSDVAQNAEVVQNAAKEAAKREREAKKEKERLAKEAMKEAKKEKERLEREAREAKKEQERLQKEAKKEQERQEREAKKEKERLEREAKKEQERLEREAKKEQERLQREQKKKEKEEQKLKEKLEKERLKREERAAEEANRPSIGKFFSITKKKPERDLPEKCDSFFQKLFLPYYVQPGVQLVVPSKRPLRSEAVASLDDILRGSNISIDKKSSCAVWLSDHHKPRGYTPSRKLKDLEGLQLLGDEEAATAMRDILNSVPLKHIEFFESVRPPYSGASTMAISRDIATHPFARHFEQSLNYDYDSEVEWTLEDEEGENLSDVEDDEDDDDAEMESEMSDFVEDDEAPKAGIQGLPVLNAVSKWNDGTSPEIFDPMEVDIFLHNVTSIDPFKCYWGSEEEISHSKKQANGIAITNATQNTQGSNKTNTASQTPTKEIISSNELSSFLGKVVGSSYSKDTLAEILSQGEFKNYTKKLIKNTIDEVAKKSRSGAKAWEAKPEYIHLMMISS